MADNFAFTAGTGLTGAADDISSVLYPRVKLITGADGTNDGDVSKTNPFPIANPIPTVAAGSGFTRPADTTAYALGDLVANSTTAGSVALDTATVAKANNEAFALVSCRLEKSTTSVSNSIFRVHIYNVAAPTFANGDNGAWSSNSKANYLGAFDVTIDKAFTDGTFGDGVPQKGTAIFGTPISGARTIAYAIEARGSYTPGNAETFKATFGAL